MKIKLFGKEKLYSGIEKLVLFLLLLSFMGVYGYGLHLMVVAFGLLCIFKMKIYTISGVLPPLLLTVTLIALGPFTLSPSTWMTRVVWPLAFLVGFDMVRTSPQDAKCMEKTEKKLNCCIAIAAVGFLIHILLNLYVNWGGVDLDRNTMDFWSKNVMAATGQAGLACVPLGWCVAQLLGNKPIKTRILFLLPLLAMLYYNLTLGSRTMIITLLILVILMTLCLLFTNYSWKQKYKMVCFLLVLSFIAIIVFSTNTWNIRTIVEDSVLAERLTDKNSPSLQEDTRWINKLEYIKLMPQHPFGGGHIYKSVGSHAHDIILDTYDDAGILAFAAILVMLWDGISKLIAAIRNPQLMLDTKITLICVYLPILLVFMVEPILNGLPWLLMTYCFLHGAVTALTKQKQGTDISDYLMKA